MNWFKRTILGVRGPYETSSDEGAKEQLLEARESLARAELDREEAERLAARLRALRQRNHFGEMIEAVLTKAQRR